jgi:biopolymer transport protein ExbD
VPVKLPDERNQPYKTKPDNINLSITKDGDVFWGEQFVPDTDTLVARLKKASVQQPQPEVHIRGDQEARYEFIGKVVLAAQRAGIAKVGFVLVPPARGS